MCHGRIAFHCCDVRFQPASQVISRIASLFARASLQPPGLTPPASADTSLNMSSSGTSGRSVSTDLRSQDKAPRVGSGLAGGARRPAAAPLAQRGSARPPRSCTFMMSISLGKRLMSRQKGPTGPQNPHGHILHPFKHPGPFNGPPGLSSRMEKDLAPQDIYRLASHRMSLFLCICRSLSRFLSLSLSVCICICICLPRQHPCALVRTQSRLTWTLRSLSPYLAAVWALLKNSPQL